MTTALEELSAYAFAASLSAEGRATLSAEARPLRAGPCLFRQEGDACDSVTLLAEGRVRVTKRRDTGREIVLYRFGRGELCVLEALAVLTGEPYRAEAFVEQAVSGLSIPGAVFRRLVDAEPALRAFLFAAFEARLAMVLEAASALALASLEARLAELLLRRAQVTPHVRTTHERLAQDLACGREAVSRLLGAWARAGIVSLGRGRLQVHDAARLAGLARSGRHAHAAAAPAEPPGRGAGAPD